MRASGNARSAVGPAVCLAGALWTLQVGAGQSQEVSSVTVNPRAVCLEPRRPPDRSVPAPQVVSTYPAQGAVVRPGYVVIRFTFNVAMSCDGIFLGMPSMQQPCGGEARQVVTYSYDRRTIQMVCHVAKSTRYGLRLNYDPNHDAARLNNVTATRVDFTSLAGAPLRRFELSFSTSAEAPLVTQMEALAAEAAASGELVDVPNGPAPPK
jgi:hypothetical protein